MSAARKHQFEIPKPHLIRGWGRVEIAPPRMVMTRWMRENHILYVWRDDFDGSIRALPNLRSPIRLCMACEMAARRASEWAMDAMEARA